MAGAARRLHLPAVQPDSRCSPRSKTSSCRCCCCRCRAARRRKRVQVALDAVGLLDRHDHYPRQLSGGQEQRVAIARAVVGDPTILVADEPTGDLDADTADATLALLKRLNDEMGKTLVMVTHDPHAAAAAKRLVRLEKGALVESIEASRLAASRRGALG